MKEIKETTTETTEKETIKYEAADGEVFERKADCEVYENHLKQILVHKYNKLVIKSTTEDAFFCGWGGSCDATIDFVKVDSHETYLLLKHLTKLHWYSSCSNDTEIGRIFQALDNQEVIAIYRGYEDDCFTPMPLLKDFIKRFNCHFSETEEL